ncbi:MAG TPA: hypothetical protein VN457_01300 [Chlamydiales bacterium]|nr:hypothetical protein [Chlamydiales bacterium]
MFLFPSRKQLITLFLALVSLRVSYYWQSDGFSLGRIENSFPKQYELARPSEEKLSLLKTICEQHFSYLGKGSQAYAFQSADGKYVLKLFKSYHLKPVPWLENLNVPAFLDTYKRFHIKRRKQRAKLALESYKITHNLIPDECGCLFLQIVPSSYFHQPVTFTDKIGRTMTIDLAKHGFMVQKKADLLFPTIARLVQEKKMADAKTLIHSIVNLIVVRSKKGIQDQDPDLHKNCGCIGLEAQFIDVGSFHTNEKAKNPEVYVNDLKKISRRLRLFLEGVSPELVQALDQELQAFAPPKQDEVLCKNPIKRDTSN